MESVTAPCWSTLLYKASRRGRPHHRWRWSSCHRRGRGQVMWSSMDASTTTRQTHPTRYWKYVKSLKPNVLYACFSFKHHDVFVNIKALLSSFSGHDYGLHAWQQSLTSVTYCWLHFWELGVISYGWLAIQRLAGLRSSRELSHQGFDLSYFLGFAVLNKVIEELCQTVLKYLEQTSLLKTVYHVKEKQYASSDA